ncbi:MAG: FCD domain-containing protein [Lachnospiraceae bacterium]|nr:FCD domain-containing protein [Lachnospiraceae bacterium]
MSQNISYLKKLNNESVVQRVINCLTDGMINKELRPGDKIPTELELSESLGVGRNSIREAIKILVYLGVLEIRRAEGTFVCEGFTESMIDPMIYGIILNQSDSYGNLMELREMMEAGVIRLAMTKYTEEDMQNLEEKLRCMKSEIEKGSKNTDAVFQADNEFHDAVSHMGHNPLIDKINRVVQMLTWSIRLDTVTHMVGTGRGQELYEAHEKICRMLKERNTNNLNQNIRDTYFENVMKNA